VIFPDLSPKDYHANHFAGATDAPPLSKSIMQKLLTNSPAHAWAAHPANPAYEPTPSEDKFHLGTAVHLLFLEDDHNRIVVLPYEDYRSNAAREAKMETLLAGKIPMLRKHFDRCALMLEALWAGVPECEAEPPLFSDGQSEVSLTWVDTGVLCKARLDWLRNDHAAIDDLKTTDNSAAPERVPGPFYSLGYDVQAAFYLRGLRANSELAENADFRFLFVETQRPFATACYRPSARSLEIANARIDWALELWKRCLAADDWPAYGTGVRLIDPPAWAETRMWDREDRDEVVA
jgi:hypothetical protein